MSQIQGINAFLIETSNRLGNIVTIRVISLYITNEAVNFASFCGGLLPGIFCILDIVKGEVLKVVELDNEVNVDVTIAFVVS